MERLQEHTELHKVEKYIETAVQGDVRQYGHLPGCCCQGPCEDVVQQVHLNLCESLGNGYLQQIAGAMSAEPSMFKETPEYAALAQAITRGIGQFRWTPNKRKQRGLPLEVPLPEGYEGLQHSESPLVEMTTDLLRLFNRWSPLERRVWQESVSGKTTRQLGKELNMDFRRVAEMRKRLFNEIASSLEWTCGGDHKWPS